MKRPIVTRREFLGSCGTAAVGLTLGGVPGCEGEIRTGNAGKTADRTQSVVVRKDKVLSEHGFWDYTTPGCGGMERYQK